MCAHFVVIIFTHDPYTFTGPFASALVNRFGCRPVCVMGSIIASAAFMLCTLSTNVNHMMLTYGVMGGIGFGLIYLPSVISVSYYFERRRALATGNSHDNSHHQSELLIAIHVLFQLHVITA